MEISDAAYIAGLFDGEGSVTYKQYMRKRKGKTKAYPTWSIELEISMTDKEVIRWVYETLNVEFNMSSWIRNLVKYGDFL